MPINVRATSAGSRGELLNEIESRLEPLLGPLMAKASVRAQCEKLHLDSSQLTHAELADLLDALAKGTRVFVGAARANTIFDALRADLLRGEPDA